MPADDLIKKELTEIADSVLMRAFNGIPASTVDSSLAFISFIRTYDYLSFISNYSGKDKPIKELDVSIMKFSWPSVVRNLYKKILRCDGFPMLG